MSSAYGEISVFVSDGCKFNGPDMAKALNLYTWVSDDDFFSWEYDQVENRLFNKYGENSTDPTLFPEKILTFCVYKAEIDDYILIESSDIFAHQEEDLQIELSEYFSLDVLINDLSCHIDSGFIQINLESDNYSCKYSITQQIIIKPDNCGSRTYSFYQKEGESGTTFENVINGVLI
jgi:hypothetical protein